MIYVARIDKHGKVFGFGTSDIEVQAGEVEISAELCEVLQQADSIYVYKNGEFLDTGQPTIPNDLALSWDHEALQWVDRRTATEAEPLALQQIDQAAGEARARYITSVPGQAETYLMKYQDAVAFQAGNGPTPWVEADAQAYGVTEAEAAQNIVDQYFAWVAVGKEIERIRLSAKASVRSATTAKEAFAVAAQAKIELEAL